MTAIHPLLPIADRIRMDRSRPNSDTQGSPLERLFMAPSPTFTEVMHQATL